MYAIFNISAAPFITSHVAQALVHSCEIAASLDCVLQAETSIQLGCIGGYSTVGHFHSTCSVPRETMATVKTKH